MARWSILATVQAPEDQVLAFRTHHLALGPARIRLCFDAPDDPEATIPRVERLRCNAQTACRETATSAALARLHNLGLLKEAPLNLRAKIATLKDIQ